MILNDKEIRDALSTFLIRKTPNPRAIINELRVSNGNAIADIVCIHKYAHCFEIKGQNDNLDRIERQCLYYNSSFRKITLVTTSNHLAKAHLSIPEFWGIILAQPLIDRVCFKYIRKAAANPLFNKEDALFTLWKKELLEVAETTRGAGLKKSFSRKELASYIAQNANTVTIQESISTLLFKRRDQPVE